MPVTDDEGARQHQCDTVGGGQFLGVVVVTWRRMHLRMDLVAARLPAFALMGLISVYRLTQRAARGPLQ